VRSYPSAYARFHERLTASGAQVVFTQRVETSYNPVTDTNVVETQKIYGLAVEIPANPEVFKNLELVVSVNKILYFSPNTVGQIPQVNATVEWADTTFTVKEVMPIAPLGEAIAARVVLE